MIVKMRKYAFMVYHKEYDCFLSSLRDLGAVHIRETKSIANQKELQDLLSERTRVNALLYKFRKTNDENKVQALAPARDITQQEALGLIESIEKLQEKEARLKTEKQSHFKNISYLEMWGDFSYQTINKLKQAGYEVTFFTCPTTHFEPKWVEEYNAVLINNFQSTTYFVTITKEGTKVAVDAERPAMPTMGLSELYSQCKQVQDEIDSLESQQKQMAYDDYNTLVAYDKQLQDKFNLANAIVQTDRQADDKLMFLEGWTTDDNAALLEEELDKQGYFFQEVEMGEEEKAPVKLKNNSYAKLFEPLTKLYSLPNYHEIDPTPLMAPFFMLFFGLCFGDGGYGLILLVVCGLLKFKVNPDYKPFLSLFQWLGGMTVLVGTLTGSFFGIALVDVPAFKAVKDYFISGDNLMTLSFIIGIFHIIFGKAVAAYKIKIQKGFKHSVASFGWVFVISFLAIGIGLPFLGLHLPQIVVNACFAVAGLGLLVAFLYNSPGKNIFLNFGTGLWNTYNVASGLLGDTLSYVRLFAIGLTGSILGGVFNQLSVIMTDGLPIVARILTMLFILVIGHSLNFGLCTISSLVHPLRLVFVEYFKNSEYEGGGTEYAPFKKA